MGIESNPSRYVRVKDSVLGYVNPRKPEHPTVTPIGEYTPGTPLENWAAHFSGHGSPQVPGMESPLRQFPQIDNLYNLASATLGTDLSSLSEKELFLTVNAQPAITLLNICSYLSHFIAFPDDLRNEPDIISSQSLGMISAGWYAGVFGDIHSLDATMLALELSQTRGEIMQTACDPPHPQTGTMLLWAGDKKRKPNPEELLALEVIREETKSREKDVSLALDISDARIVVGGKKSDLKDFHKQMKQRFHELHINFYDLPTNSGAFHTKYMEGVTQEIRTMFENVKHLMHDPQIPLLSNSLEEPMLIKTVDAFIEEMVRLCTKPVWGRAMETYLTERGIDMGLEFGQRGIIANSLDRDFFDVTPRKAAIAGTALATGAAVTTAIFIKRRGKND